MANEQLRQADIACDMIIIIIIVFIIHDMEYLSALWITCDGCRTPESRLR